MRPLPLPSRPEPYPETGSEWHFGSHGQAQLARAASGLHGQSRRAGTHVTRFLHNLSANGTGCFLSRWPDSSAPSKPGCRGVCRLNPIATRMEVRHACI